MSSVRFAAVHIQDNTPSLLAAACSHLLLRALSRPLSLPLFAVFTVSPDGKTKNLHVKMLKRRRDADGGRETLRLHFQLVMQPWLLAT